jgi:hypothetical protein
MGEWGPVSVFLCVLSGKKLFHSVHSALVFFDYGDRSVSSAFISGKGFAFQFRRFLAILAFLAICPIRVDSR